MDERTNSPVAGAALFLIAATLWGTVGPAQVLAGGSMAPAALGGWRLLAGGAVLGTFTVARPKRLRTLAARSVVRPLLVCALATGLYQAAFLSAVARTGAALATVICLGSVPAATGLYARRVNRERIRPAWVVSSAAAVGGCALLLTPDGGTPVDPLGLAMAVVSAICYAVYTVHAKQLSVAKPDADLPTLSALSLIAGSLILLPWMIGDAGALRNGTALALVAWLSVAASAIPYWLYSIGLRQVRATTAGTLSLAEPLSAALLGVLVLHEHLSASACAGCALILVGMIAMCLPSRPSDRVRDDARAPAQ